MRSSPSFGLPAPFPAARPARIFSTGGEVGNRLIRTPRRLHRARSAHGVSAGRERTELQGQLGVSGILQQDLTFFEGIIHEYIQPLLPSPTQIRWHHESEQRSSNEDLSE